MNRILGQSPSQIFGSLRANGQVFLLNPNGVLFAPGSRVNVGGLVATSLNLSDADFLAGRLTFTRNASSGAVINQGTITTTNGGYVALMGPQVKKQYDATYSATPVLGTGNGFLYSVAPVITPLLVGVVSKVYDSTTAATLAAANYAVNGAIDGDTVLLNNPTAGTYNNPNPGVNKNVSVSGIAIASTTNGAATVYGYQLGSSTANANIGVITPSGVFVVTETTDQTKAQAAALASIAKRYGRQIYEVENFGIRLPDGLK